MSVEFLGFKFLPRVPVCSKITLIGTGTCLCIEIYPIPVSYNTWLPYINVVPKSVRPHYELESK